MSGMDLGPDEVRRLLHQSVAGHPDSPDAFDRIQRGYRRRRALRRIGVAAVAAIVLGGGTAVAMQLLPGGTDQSLRIQVPTSPSATTSPSPNPSPTPTLRASVAPSSRPTASPPTPTLAEPVYRGRVVDEAGQPLLNISVFTDTLNPYGQPIVAREALTSSNGTFQLACPTGPVILVAGSLAAWNADPTTDLPPEIAGVNTGNYAMTIVGNPSSWAAAVAPPCTSNPSAPYPTTVMNAGATITVYISHDGHPASNSISFSCGLGDFCDMTANANLPSGLVSFTGLGRGAYNLLVDECGGPGYQASVSVVDGQHVTVPLDQCTSFPGESSPTPSPATTASRPSPTTSASPTPSGA
jgi:hypothetical protein